MEHQALRPLGLGEIIDTAFKIYVRHWRSLMLLVAAVVIPAGVIESLLLADALPDDLVQSLGDPNVVPDEETLEAAFRFLRLATAAAFVQAVAAILANAGTVRAVADVYLGNAPDWRESLGVAFRRLAAVLGTVLLIVVALAAISVAAWLLISFTALSASGRLGGLGILGMLGWLVLIVWLGVSWVAAIPTLIIERVRPSEALSRSFSLVRGRWWPTFGTLLVILLIVTVISGIATRVIGAFLPEPAGAPAGAVITIAIAIATTPFTVSALAVLYFDLRTRKEAFGLTHLATDIGALPPDPLGEPPAPPRPEDGPDWPPLPPDPDAGSSPPGG